jgi:hypothetical protein
MPAEVDLRPQRETVLLVDRLDDTDSSVEAGQELHGSIRAVWYADG